jgi:hypothetical protein
MKELKITSNAFKNNGLIPAKYTCDGNNMNPPLNIEGAPKEAATLVLIMDDPDIPQFVKEKFGIEVWDHWVVFNIPTNVTRISEGCNPPGILGKNTRNENVYTGPCPPDREHRYFFKVYALDTKLDIDKNSTKQDVERAMKDHIIAKGELIGLYKRH